MNMNVEEIFDKPAPEAPKKKRVLTEAQKEGLARGRAKAKAMREAKKREKVWEERRAEIDAFQRTLRYRFFSKVRAVLSRILDWVQKQTVTPSPSSIKTDRQRAAKKARTKPSFWKDF